MYNLIIVEDDFQIRTGLSRFFPWNELNFQIAGCFENGRQAFDFILSNNVDVVLADIKMPVMDGLELVKELNRHKINTLVIFLSAYRDFDYAQQAINMGVKNYIVKSTKYDDLVSVFSKIREELDEKNSKSNKTFFNNNFRANPENPSNKIIQKITCYAEQNFKNATLQSIAYEVNMNPIYLSRFFKEKMGVNFKDFISEIKMKKAVELLEKEKYMLYQISEMVGYSNEKSFARAFKRYYSINPHDYKNII